MKNRKIETPEQKYQRELEMLKKRETLNNYLKTGHSMPRTRREFLGSGLLAGISTLAVPSFLQLISQRAEAQALSSECSALLEPTAQWMPYVQVSLGGGAALHSSLFILDKNRDLLPSYHRLGLGKAGTVNVVREFGSVPLAQYNGQYVGQVMKGLTDVAGASVLSKTALVKFCVRSQDDRVNPDGIMGLVTAAGRKGIDLPNLGTPRGQSRAAFIRASAVQGVSDVDALIDSLAPQGALNTYLGTPSRRDALLKLVKNLNASQRKTLDTNASAQTLGKLMECSTGKNIQVAAADKTVFDPRLNSAVAQVWGIGTATDPGLREALHATVVYNALNGKSGAARIDLGGYDYHGSERPTQNALDLDGGQIIGRILRTAEAMQKSVFIHVTSDGSVEGGSEGIDGRFGADAGTRGSGCFIVYNPAGRPATTDSQIGHFNASQAVDDSFINTWTVDRCALAVFANYLQLHKKVGMLQSIAPNEFDTAGLNKVVKVA